MQTETTTRAEHLAWCKKRALEYCDRGEDSEAFSSMCSDLGKHPATANHIGIQLGAAMLVGGHMRTGEIRRWIEGFN